MFIGCKFVATYIMNRFCLQKDDKIIILCMFFAAFASLFSPSLNSIALYFAIPLAFILSFRKYRFRHISKTFKIITILYIWIFISSFWAISNYAALAELKVCLGTFMLCYIFTVNSNKKNLIPLLYITYIILYLSAWNYAHKNILVDMTVLGAEGERMNDTILNANTMAYYTFFVTFSIFVLGEIKQRLIIKSIIKWLFIFMIPITFLVAILTASRQVLIIQIPLFIILLYFRYLRNTTNNKKVLFVFIALCVGLYFVGDIYNMYKNSYLYTRSLDNVNDDIRSLLIKDAFKVGLDNFFTGVGAGCYIIVSRYKAFAHTTYLELFANTGIMGVSLFVWAIINFLLTQISRYKETKDLMFLLFFVFGIFFAFDNIFYVFYSSVWLLGIFMLVAAHSDQHFKTNYCRL